jgi:adenylosuccinate lyase
VVLAQTEFVLTGLQVEPNKMSNLDLTKGLIVSERR